VPDESQTRIDEIKAGLKDGSFAVWKGPIMDNVPRLPLGGYFCFWSGNERDETCGERPFA
jgi:hypothetical protein